MSILSRGVQVIAIERQRQMDVKGYTPEHDAEHAPEDLMAAASSYLIWADGRHAAEALTDWPWDPEAFKPRSPMDALIKAGALIAAGIDRLAMEEKNDDRS